VSQSKTCALRVKEDDMNRKIEIVVVYDDRYLSGHERAFVPPLTGMHLAALVGERAEVSLRHEKVRPLDPSRPSADVYFLSTGTGFAPRAYALADRLMSLGRTVVIGGPHATVFTEEALGHADAVVAGEAEGAIGELLADLGRSGLRRVYSSPPGPLDGLPPPRYDLLEPAYFIGRTVMATRGCPFGCSFCSTPRLSPGFRTRPVDEVIRDIESYSGRTWYQRRVVWFWDDNLTADKRYAKDLLFEMVPLGKLWVTQASIECTYDVRLLRLMADSGCMGVFLGIETLSRENLRAVAKGHNIPSRYEDAVRRLHDHGIAVMAGFLVGFDTETPDDVVSVADGLQRIGVDVPFLSILTPFGETPLRETLEKQGLLLDRGWEFYNGYNVTYRPRRMSPLDLEHAHRALWARSFSARRVAGRIARGALRLAPRGLALSALMNGYYGMKNARGTGPLTPSPQPAA
jgi:radical SAM superfamily enzyme YgiQ (UPF0313 family)